MHLLMASIHMYMASDETEEVEDEYNEDKAKRYLHY
jgi:hypothetical protein